MFRGNGFFDDFQALVTLPPEEDRAYFASYADNEFAFRATDLVMPATEPAPRRRQDGQGRFFTMRLRPSTEERLNQLLEGLEDVNVNRTELLHSLIEAVDPSAARLAVAARRGRIAEHHVPGRN